MHEKNRGLSASLRALTEQCVLQAYSSLSKDKRAALNEIGPKDQSEVGTCFGCSFRFVVLAF